MASEPVTPQGSDAPTLRPVSDANAANETMSLSAGSNAAKEATDPTLAAIAPGLTPGDAQAAHARRLGPYTLVRLLGRGGMGAVWEAQDTRLNRRVALKVMVAGEQASVQETERFRREAQNSAKLRHPNIVPVHDFGDEGGRHYLVMDLVDGVILGDALRQQQFTYRAKAALLEKVARAVQYAHEQGVIHRDLKPANIMLEFRAGGSSSVARAACARSAASPPASSAPTEVAPASPPVAPASPPVAPLRTGTSSLGTPQSAIADLQSGEPLVMDFGLAKDLAKDSSLSQSGQVMGTPAYMPPEQAEGRARDVGPRSDVYSLGAILYEMLAGRAPFAGENMMQVLRSVCNDDPAPPRQIDPHIPRDLETMCLKCLEKKPERRYASAAALADDLKAWQNGDSISARPPKALERIVKRWRKNPAAYTVSAVALVVLMATSSAFVWSVNKKRREAELARDEAVKAHRDFVAEQEARAKKEAEVKALEKQAATESKREWNLVFEDTFSYGDQTPEATQALLEEHWQLTGGNWDLRNGELRSSGAGYHWAILKQPVPGDVRIEFDCHEDGSNLDEVTCFMNARPRKTWGGGNAGYFFRYGAEGDTASVLAHEKDILFKNFYSALVRGKRYHVRAERMGKRLTMTLDDKVVIDAEDTVQGAIGPDEALAGLRARNSEICFDNFRIYTLGPPLKADLLDVAENHLRRKDYTTARALFEDVLNSTTDQARTRAARFGKARAVANLELAANNEALLKAWPETKFSLQVHECGLLLNVAKTAISDLSPVKGMSLGGLDISGGKVTDLSLFKDVPLNYLSWADSKLADLEPLRGMQLAWLNCSGNGLASLEPLRGMKLFKLECQNNPIGSLEPLRGMPLLELNIQGTKVDDLSLLRDFPLESIALDYTPKRDETLLRGIKTLKTINGLTSEVFWGSDTTSQVRCFVGKGFGEGLYVGDVAFLPDGKRVIFSSGDKLLRLWDTQSGEVIREYKGHKGWVFGIALSRDGTRCLSAGGDKSWRLWEVESGKEIQRAELTCGVNSVALSEDEKQVVGALGVGSVRLWDIETARELRRFEGHIKQAWGVAFSRDGKNVLATSSDGTLRCWDRQTGAPLHCFDAKAPVHAIVLSRDGKQALIGCDDGSVRLLDLEKWTEVRRFLGPTKPVWGVAFSPDGKWVLAGSEDTSLRLWDFESGRQLRRFQRHTRSVTGVAFSPDGRYAVSGGMDNTLRLWAIPGPEADEPAKAR